MLAVIMFLLAGSAPLAARTAVQEHARHRNQVVKQLRRLRAQHHRALKRLELDLDQARTLLQRRGRVDPARWFWLRDFALREVRETGRELARIERLWRRRHRKLAGRREAHGVWLSRWGMFQVCPVPGFTIVHDDFGEITAVGPAKPHVHMGNDIQAPMWSRILAPFDGYAVGSSSPLGGTQVRVYGARGYVYNAHLIGYGHLGNVQAGDVVGYVGSTGNSTAPHDHFEWHPWDGGAVDPHPYLALSCYGK